MFSFDNRRPKLKNENLRENRNRTDLRFRFCLIIGPAL